jgi:8-oxo-dGTP diphosphatase
MPNIFQPVVSAIIKKDGKYLLTLRDDRTPDGDHNEFHGMWQLPGGGVEFGESLEEALYRECKEEVGIDVVIDSLVPVVQSAVRDSWQGIFIAYLCHMKNENDKIVINEEASDFGWYSFEECSNMPLTKFTQVDVVHASQMKI